VGRLHLIEGIMDQDIYMGILLEPMLPSADLLFGRENWYFQQDNDSKHTTKCVCQWSVYHNIPKIEWPAQSPDLNPIESLWSLLDQTTANRKVNTEEELFECLQKA
jgi:hypothetical protein